MSSEPKTVKVFNLTDISTPNLVQRKMLDHHIAIAGRMCEPGEFVEVEDSLSLREDCKHLVAIGALSIGALPPPYMQARNAKTSSGGNLSPARVGHLEVKETKVAEDPPAPPSPPADTSAPAETPAPVASSKSSNKNRQ